MREPPHLSDESILAAIKAKYGIAGTDLTFLPIGYDSFAWVYRLRDSDGVSYFLKARKGPIYESSLLIPRYLYEHGMTHVMSPLPTTTQMLWTTLEDFSLILYPFIEGRAGMEGGLTEGQWIAFGALVKQIHSIVLPPALLQAIRHQTFSSPWRDVLDKVEARIAARVFTDPYEHELAAFWQAHAAVIHTIVERAVALGQRLQRTDPPFVLCHTDLHTGNVMVDTQGQLWIVDWDETTVAPKERDLMFMVGGISAKWIGPREESLFFQGYGQSTVDPLALSYYRYVWAAQDIGAYSADVFLRPDLGPVSKSSAVQSVKSLFQPGEIVDLAYASDRGAI